MGRFPKYGRVGTINIPGFFSEKIFEESLEYKPRVEDVILSTFPKCGTTWTQQMVLLIYTRGEPFDALHFFKHSPFLEMAGIEAVVKMPQPGCIKTHLPFDLTPQSKNAKYIYVVRNPKDTCVSLFHHCRNFPGYEFADGKFEDFFEVFIKGDTEWGDYFDHLLGWYKHKDDPNVLFMTYESIKADHKGTVLKLAKFLGQDHYEAMKKDPGALDNVVMRSTVDYMKKHSDSAFSDLFALPPEMLEANPDLTEGAKFALAGLSIKPGDGKREFNFIRQGTVGGWRALFTPEQSKIMDEKFLLKAQGTDIMDLFKGYLEY